MASGSLCRLMAATSKRCASRDMVVLLSLTCSSLSLFEPHSLELMLAHSHGRGGSGGRRLVDGGERLSDVKALVSCRTKGKGRV